MPIHPPTSHEHDSARDLSGRTAVVTGASSGIGQAIALELANAGADILVHARTSREAANQTAEAIGSQDRKTLVALNDLAIPSEQDALVATAWNWRDIDIWINNAGADVLTGEAAAKTFDKKLELLWDVDVVATVRLSRAVGRLMTQRGSGVILNVGWNQTATGMAGDSGEMFAAAKGAITAFTKSLANSLAPLVRVNCLAPGWIKTKWGDSASEDWQRRATTESLSGRWGTPEDVARVARFLASDAASFVNGQTVNVDGGVAKD